jgi:hypothetical protein
MAVFTTTSSTSSIARLFLLLTLALSFFATVIATPIPAAPAELSTEEVRNVDLTVESGDLEKRITHTGRGTYFYQNGNQG